MAIPRGAAAQAPFWRALTTINQAPGNSCRIADVKVYHRPNTGAFLYVTGDFSGTATIGTTQLVSAGGTDGFLAKWGPTGFVWAMRFGGSGDDHATAVEVNDTDTYVAGSFRGSAADFGRFTLTNSGGPLSSDAFVAKATDANQSAYFEWAQAVSGPGDEQATSLSVWGRDVFAGGWYSSASASFGNNVLTNAGAPNSDGFVINLYDWGPTGDTQWAFPVSGPGNEQVTTVTGGNLYVFFAGEFNGPSAGIGTAQLLNSGIAGSRDAFVGMLEDTYAMGPRYRWAYRGGGPGDDRATALGRTPQGVYLTGAFAGPSASFGRHTLYNAAPGGQTTDLFLTKIINTGTSANFSSAEFAWALRGGGPGNEVGMGVTDGVGTLTTTYVVGSFDGNAVIGPDVLPNAGSGATTDLFAARITDFGPAGVIEWGKPAGGRGSDLASASTFSNLNGDGIYVVGEATVPASFDNLTTTGPAGNKTGYIAELVDTAPALGTAITGDTVLCAGQSATLQAVASQAATGYLWSTGATTSSIQVTQPGVYTVTVTFPGGVTRLTRQRVTLLAPTLAIAGDSILCPGASLQLLATATPTPTSFQWNTGATTPALTVTQAGTYVVTAGFGNGCTVSRRVVVGSPTVRIEGPGSICPGGSGVLRAEAPGAVSYRWSTGATTPNLPLTQPGTYTVTATYAGGCSLSATQAVSLASATITGDSTICAGSSVSLTAAQPTATAYLWSTGATTPAIAVSQPGTYTVAVSFGPGCQRTASYRLRQLPPAPAFSLGADTTVCDGVGLLLRPTGYPGGGATAQFRWSTGASTPTLLVREAGTYRLDITTACGTRTASRTVAYKPCLMVPNIITPNNDQLNDRFEIVGLAGRWSLQVFSRWGQRVFTSEAYDNSWGAEAAPGTYYYLLRRTDQAAPLYKGWVEVHR